MLRGKVVLLAFLVGGIFTHTNLNIVAATDFIHHDRRPSEEETLSRVKEFVALLGDQDCEKRENAIFQKFQLLANVPDHVFTKEIAARSNKSMRKLSDLLTARSRQNEVGDEFEKLLQELIFPALTAIGTGETGLLGKSKDTLLEIARSRAAPIPKRQAAIGAMFFVVEKYSDPGGMLEKQGMPVSLLSISQWKRDLVALLRSDDLFLRTEVAGFIGVSNAFRDVEKELIVPTLLNALSENDMSTRRLAQSALIKVSGEKFCIDPTDFSDDREEGIQKWKHWWEERKIH